MIRAGILMTAMKLFLWGAVVAGTVALTTPVQAQRQGRGRPPQEGGITPVEIQRMFDAYALLQAQEQLKISDDQYPQFVTRFKALQDVRRRALQERARVVMDLRRILNDTPPDETRIKERLRTLEEIESRSAGATRKAYEAIDRLLDLRQQAQFRVFEELMERRKLDLVTRARLDNRPRRQP